MPSVLRLLWFGWFGFNAGSGLAADSLAGSAFLATHVATAAAALGWTLLEWIFSKKPTIVGVCTGAVAGLVAITPAAGFVECNRSDYNRIPGGCDLLLYGSGGKSKIGLR